MIDAHPASGAPRARQVAAPAGGSVRAIAQGSGLTAGHPAHVVSAQDPDHLPAVPAGATLERRIGESLQDLDGLAARVAHVFVNRHAENVVNSRRMSTAARRFLQIPKRRGVRHLRASHTRPDRCLSCQSPPRVPPLWARVT